MQATGLGSLCSPSEILTVAYCGGVEDYVCTFGVVRDGDGWFRGFASCKGCAVFWLGVRIATVHIAWLRREAY